MLLRHPTPPTSIREVETEPIRATVEKRFLRWILQGDCRPGQTINILELSRQFGVSALRSANISTASSAIGLVERRPSGSWMFRGFTREFAEELYEVRAMFELRAALDS